MFAPYVFDDPRLANAREEQCDAGVLTKARCLSTAIGVCRDCKEAFCDEHLSHGLCVECRLDREMVVAA